MDTDQRPDIEVRFLTLQLPTAAAGESKYAQSSRLGRSFSIQQIQIISDDFSVAAYVRLGVSSGQVIDDASRATALSIGLAAGSATNAQCNDAIPIVGTQIYIGPISIFFGDPDLRIWAEIINGDGTKSLNAVVIVTLDLQTSDEAAALPAQPKPNTLPGFPAASGGLQPTSPFQP